MLDCLLICAATQGLRGSALVMKDLLAGHIPTTMDNLPPYLPHINTGALKALGVSSSKRWFALPDVPTIAEQGFDGFDAAPWWYVAAPAGTPKEIVQKLSDLCVEGGKTERVQKINETFGIDESARDRVYFKKVMDEEGPVMIEVVKSLNIEPA